MEIKCYYLNQSNAFLSLNEQTVFALCFSFFYLFFESINSYIQGILYLSLCLNLYSLSLFIWSPFLFSLSLLSFLFLNKLSLHFVSHSLFLISVLISLFKIWFTSLSVLICNLSVSPFLFSLFLLSFLLLQNAVRCCF